MKLISKMKNLRTGRAVLEGQPPAAELPEVAADRRFEVHRRGYSAGFRSAGIERADIDVDLVVGDQLAFHAEDIDEGQRNLRAIVASIGNLALAH